MDWVGQYRVRGELGRGGAGIVLRAEGPSGEGVAIKLLLAGRGASEFARRRFAREAEALSKLAHPYLVAVREVGEHEGCPYLVMDLVEGEDLEAVLRRGGPLAAAPAVELVRRLAQALAHVHAAGVLHRDVKPANVLIDRRGMPRLGDFGLAKDLDPARSRLSTTGAFVGTPAYWPPEQARGARELGPPADVFALGGTLYHLLSGEPPHQAHSLAEVMQRGGYEPPRPLRERAPQVDPRLAAIVDRCLADDPAQRFPSMEALIEALAAWTPAPAGSRWRALPLGLGAGVALTLLAALAWRGATLARPAAQPEPPAAQPEPAAALPEPAASPPEPTAQGPDSAAQGSDSAAQGPDSAAQGSDSEAQGPDSASPQLASPRPVASQSASPQPAASAPGPGLSEAEARVKRSMAKVSALMRRGDHQAALGLVESFVAEEPRAPGPYLMRASVRFALARDRAGALRDLEQAGELGPNLAWVWHSRAQLESRHLSPGGGGLESARRAAALDPQSAEVRVTLGRALIRLGRHEEAGEVLDRALELDASSVYGWINRSWVAISQKRYADAIGDCRRALALDPRNALALENLGMALDRSGEGEEALRVYDQAVAAEGTATAFYGLARCLARLGRVEEAIQAYTRALSPRSRERGVNVPQTLVQRGLLQAKLRRHEAALADYRRALELDPEYAKAHFHRGAALASLKRYDLAEEATREALRLDPRHAGAARNMGVFLGMRARWQEALPYVERALELRPEWWEVYMDRATVYTNLGRLEEAERDVALFLQRAPSSPQRARALELKRKINARLRE